MSALDRQTFDNLTAGLDSTRTASMSEAFELFSTMEMPSEKEENWRYVALGLDLADAHLADEPGDPMPPGAFLQSLGSATVSLIDGHVVTLETTDAVSVSRLAESGLGDPVVPFSHDKFAAARGAFGIDGVVIEIARNAVLEAPIVIDVQSTQRAASFPTISVRTGSNAEASVVLVFRSPEGMASVVAPGVILSADDGSRLRFLTVQDLGLASTLVTHQRAIIGRDASVRIGEVGLGGRVARVDLGMLLEGSGASGEVVGLSFGEHDQTLDYRMVITHRGKNTSSDVFLKGAVEDEAQSVFTGLLKIEKDATRSSAFETNRNLVLSEGAKAHSVPNLEILCDDVICGHGSSVGPLDEDSLYYLRSRGLPRARAERLLIKGFFQEVIDRLPVSGLEEPLQAAVFQRFIEAQAEGRVA